ncbi:MAG TPA: ATPase domain-containing protein [Kofleriaceae bacterium]|nr:ATPase domain-containing protein [Kofleriaceae bacterium]
MTDATMLDRLSSGVPGLDTVLEGGLLRGGVYLVQGPPGSGKTILGNQMCFAHAAGGGRAVYMTLLAESHTRMLAHMRRMHFYRTELIPDQVHYLSAFKVLEGDGLHGLLTVLRKTVTSRSATLLVLDGLVSAEEASPSAKEFKKFVHELQIVCAMTACTCLLLSSTERPRSFRPEHTMVDGILELGDDLRSLRAVRSIVVRKMRGTAPVLGRHTIEINDDGVSVVPRFETRTSPALGELAPTPRERLALGIASLDAMLGGGLPARSITMLLGPTGVGKTTLALQFLGAGAARNEPGVFFGFYEHPPALLERSRRLQLGFVDIAHSPVELIWHRPVEGIIDVVGDRLLDAIKRRNARRLVIDGMAGFQVSVDEPDRVREVFATLADELAHEGVTTVYTMETTDLLGPRIEVPLKGVSAITHNIILMRHVEMEARLYRLLSILKMRDGDYDSAIREFRIDDGGIEILDTFHMADRILTGTAKTNGTRRSKRGGGGARKAGGARRKGPRRRS